ncbi:MAG: S41 family peptidase, partial [Bacteroidales bacterium]|nr:S41 family peptidase [Bacteroidales bacterium]
MKRILIIISAVAALLSGQSAFSQSKSFKMGQWTEIQGSILRELNRSYVDSLQLDKIMRAGIDAMLEQLDPYTVYVPQEEQDDFEMMINKSYGGIGAIIQKKVGEYVVINEPYYGSPAWKNHLVCGDEIMEIDGEDTKPLVSKEASEKMKGKPGTKVVFTVKKVRTGEIVKMTIVREKIHLPDIDYTGMLDSKTGYILQSGFTEGVSESIKKSVLELKKQGMERLVLDLRGNGGGLLSEAVGIVSLFVPKGTSVVTAKGRAEGSFKEYKTVTEPIDTQIPIIVMIDGGSASASEIVSGALQDLDRATIMGVRSYGKGLVQSVRPLAYDGQLKVTWAKYYTPSGRCVQARDYSNRNEDGSVGVIPDSLTHEFKTAKGRIVRDGGGITPDVVIPFKSHSRLIYSLVLNGIVESYAIEFCRKHESIPEVDDFKLSDKDFEDFVQYAMTQNFDYRSSAKTLFDQMKKELEEDGTAQTMTEQLAALEKALEIDKASFIRLRREEIVPFIEEEIAIRYYYQEAGVKVRLK